MEKVSIIIPTYQRSNLLKYAVKSALLQSYSNKEIIIVDGNTDNSTSLVLSKYRDQIKIIKDTQRTGVAAARNRGIQESSGDYITFLDDDDIFHPQKIQRQIQKFTRETIGLVYCPVGIRKNNTILYKPFKHRENNWMRLIDQNKIIMTPLIKKECFSVCGMFDESLPYHEDRDMWYRMSKQYQFEYINYPYYLWYHPNIYRLSSQEQRMCTGILKIYEKHDDDFPDKKKYYADLNYELSRTHLKFKSYTKFIRHFSMALKLNPMTFLQYVKKLASAFRIGIKTTRIDIEIRKIVE